jgi:hypothetical protein
VFLCLLSKLCIEIFHCLFYGFNPGLHITEFIYCSSTIVFYLAYICVHQSCNRAGLFNGPVRKHHGPGLTGIFEKFVAIKSGNINVIERGLQHRKHFRMFFR